MGSAMPLSSSVRSLATGTGPLAAGDQLGAHQDLAGAGGRGDASGAGDGRAEVVAVACGRLAGVEPDAHRRREAVLGAMAGQGPLDRGGARDAVVGLSEDHEEPVAPVLDLLALSTARTRPARCGRASAAAAPRRASPIGLGQPRRLHDVGEHERAERVRGRLRRRVEAAMSRSTAAPISSTVRAAASSSRRAPRRRRRPPGPGRAGRAPGRPRRGRRPRTRCGRPPAATAIAPSVSPRWRASSPRRDRRRGRRSGRAQPPSEVLELGDALGRRLLVAHREARGDVHREHEDPTLACEEALIRRAPALRLRTAARASPLGEQQPSPSRAGRHHRSATACAAPPRHRSGRRDGPGSRPARCSPRRRCSG